MATIQHFQYVPNHWAAFVVDATLTQADVDAQFPMGIYNGGLYNILVNADGTADIGATHLAYGSRIMWEVDPLGNATGNQRWTTADQWDDGLVQNV